MLTDRVNGQEVDRFPCARGGTEESLRELDSARMIFCQTDFQPGGVVDIGFGNYESKRLTAPGLLTSAPGILVQRQEAMGRRTHYLGV